MTPIVTLTPNPALDVSTSVERVEPEHKLRCGPATLDPGGGGVNVARVVTRLGGRATAIFAAGGPTGAAFRGMVEAEGVESRAVEIGGDTRQSFTVDETKTADQYRFVLQGPRLTEQECGAVIEAVGEALSPETLLVASGSLPPGAPDDFYGQIARLAKERGARCVLDTSGAALSAALEEGVFLVKPNRRELGRLTGETLEDPQRQEAAACALVERGAAEFVALTLGAEGAVLAWRDGTLRLPSPKVEPKSAVGAGDSFVGGFVTSLAGGASPQEAFRYACAAGAAALLTPATELCRRDDVERLAGEIERTGAGAA